MSRVKVFFYCSPDTLKIEKDINDFLESGNKTAVHIEQTESCNSGGWNLTISIWYEVKV